MVRLQPATGVVHGAPVGARVVRGPDWKWDDQDGDSLGTILGGGRLTEDNMEADVKWDRRRRNVYRTGPVYYDLVYAPGAEAREEPEAAAKRNGHTEAAKVFEAARWWCETPMTDITRTMQPPDAKDMHTALRQRGPRPGVPACPPRGRRL